MTLDRKYILAGLSLVAGLAFLYVILGQAVHAPPTALPRLQLETPIPGPAESFSDAQGKPHSLAEYRGRFVLLNVWATWCAPCLRELPALSRLSGEIPSGRLAIVAVAVPPGDVARAALFLRENDAPGLRPYFDTGAGLLRSLRANGLPVTILVAPDGKEIGRAVGAQRWDEKGSLEYLKLLTARS